MPDEKYYSCECGDLRHTIRTSFNKWGDLDAEFLIEFMPDEHMGLRWRIKQAWKVFRGREYEGGAFISLNEETANRLASDIKELEW